jgi:hypothetical protein
MQENILMKCNCTDPLSLSLFNSTTCEDVTQQKCMNDQYAWMFDENYITLTCVPLCPLECNKTYIRTFETSNDIIGDLYYDYIRSNVNLRSDFLNGPITVEQAKNSFSFVVFYYDSNSYTLSTQAPTMDVVALLANIGGTLGLFLGISLIQVCEIVDVFIQILFFKNHLLDKNQVI